MAGQFENLSPAEQEKVVKRREYLNRLTQQANKYGDDALKSAKEIKNQWNDMAKTVAGFSGDQKELTKSLGLQEAYARKMELSTRKNTEANQRDLAIADSMIDSVSEVVKLRGKNNDFLKKAVPFSDKIADLEAEKKALMSGQLNLSASEFKSRKKTLDQALKTTKAASSAMQVEERRNKILEKGLGPILKARDGMQNMMLSARAMMSPLGLISGIFILIGAAVKFLVAGFKEWTQAQDNFYKSTGLARGQVQGLHENVGQVAYEFAEVGMSVDDAYQSMGALYTQFQSTSMLTKTMMDNMKTLQGNIGLGGEESAKLLQTMLSMNGASQEGLSDQIETARQMALQNGLAPKDVLEDMANASADTLSHFRGSTDELIKASVQARKMGLSLATMGSAADNLLDIEASIEAEMEASMLIGRRINMDQARRLALQGDLAGMGQEILKQAGGLTEFNKMNTFQQKALAKAAGMELGDMRKMLETADRRSKMSDAERKKEDATARATKELQSGWSQLVNKIKAFGVMIGGFILPYITEFVDKVMGGNSSFEVMQEKAKAIAETVKGWLNSLYAWLDGLDGVEGDCVNIEVIFNKIWNNIIMIKDAIIGTIKFVKNWYKEIFAIWLLYKGISIYAKMKPAFTPGGGGKTPAAPVGGGGGGANVSKTKGMDKMAKSSKKLTGGSMAKNMLAGAAALLILSAALWVTAKALKELNGVGWKEVGIAAVMMLVLVGAVAAIGAIMMSGVGAVAILAGAAALLILSVSLMAIGKAFSLAGPGFESFGNMIRNVMGGIGEIITAVGDAIAKIISTTADSIKKMEKIDGGKLLNVAVGVAALGAALAAYGVGGLFAGIGSAIGEFFGGDPVEKFKRFGALGPGLQTTAKGILAVASAIDSWNIGQQVDELGRLTNAIYDLKTAADKAGSGGGIVGGIKSAVAGVKNFGGKVLRGGRKLASRAWSGFKGLFGFAGGGIIPATPGGQQVVVAEGGQNEAIVPLPNGSSIPVQFTGGGGGDNADVIAAINGLAAVMSKMNITMDGQKVGNIIAEGTPNPGMV